MQTAPPATGRADAGAVRLRCFATVTARYRDTVEAGTGMPAKRWSLTTLRDRLVKIGARIVRHRRSIAFQMSEVAVPRVLFQEILAAIAALRPVPPVRG
jgi:Transposase DDE domain group 1